MHLLPESFCLFLCVDYVKVTLLSVRNPAVSFSSQPLGCCKAQVSKLSPVLGTASGYLVDFLPAVLIRNAQLGPVVQQQLAAAGVAPHHGCVEQGGQPSAVLVVGGAPKVQKCLQRDRQLRKKGQMAVLVPRGW